MSELQQLLQELGGARLWVEVLVLLACVSLAWGLARGLRRGAAPDSVWFGRYTIDGLLFPVLALVFIYAARYGVALYQPVVVLKVALPIFVSLAAIRLFVRVLGASFPQSSTIKLIESVVSWLAWGGAVLWITGLLPAVLAELDAISFAFGKTRISLRTLLEGVLSSGVMLVVVLWISATIEKRILREAVGDLSMRKVAANAIRAALLLVGLLFALSAVGVDLTALSVMGGALGVGLGFGLQKLAANYVSGFVILIERSLRIGDLVRVDNFEGVVRDITTRYTLIRALNGRESVVPNELIITQRVENLTAADPMVSLNVNVTVAYDSDVDRVQQILLQAAANPRVLREPAPAAYLVNFGPDGLEFSLSVWIRDPENGQQGLRSELNLAILGGLREAGIEIPYPQRVVHMKS
ncbi:MAG: mechanosensitive ion channel [Hylemonella sp.]|uniref:mechanosensitive ion channel family protein n=1 Tax=Hylemonella sp. TaxID=2066020 RepID=UPI0022BAD1F5|nr:mechanosensitive ion channel domain-containing protein [Hylemonella sp.]MCZ8251973.1 mechanosensitive ion channel [Hylemonella sp.]